MWHRVEDVELVAEAVREGLRVVLVLVARVVVPVLVGVVDDALLLPLVPGARAGDVELCDRAVGPSIGAAATMWRVIDGLQNRRCPGCL